jgi:signal transduction histidine kinase
MRKIALVFMLAVIAPSLVLAWLAVRSVRDQQIVVAQQQTLLYQSVADTLAKDARNYLAERQKDFSQTVEALRAKHSSAELANNFDNLLRQNCAFAEVGFTVSADGSVLSPSLFDRAEARQFRLNNERFLGSCESVKVYWNSPKGAIDLSVFDSKEAQERLNQQQASLAKQAPPDVPLKAKYAMVKDPSEMSKLAPEEAEFKQLVGNSSEGTVARFLENKLKVLLWYRSAREPDMIYGAQLNLSNIVAGMAPVIRAPDSVRSDVEVALLNDSERVIAGRRTKEKPFVTTEIGEALPHWKTAVYLRSPEVLTRSVRTLKLTLMLIVVVMISAIGLGSALIVSDLNGQLRLARQKTDFVSNVSHELKTPLTSIRMFSELLSEGKVTDDAQRKQFLQIITTETARLTRLINNVLDFARMERGEARYHFKACDLNAVVSETVGLYRTHLEAKGFHVTAKLPAASTIVAGDCDALSQVLVNLLSNAEKYSEHDKEISVELEVVGQRDEQKRREEESNHLFSRSPCPPIAQIRVLDCGSGVPRGCEEKIFEQFYRAHDSLSSGVQGSGLGLTLARQIVRAHHGELRYERRETRGSCFIISLPIKNGEHA